MAYLSIVVEDINFRCLWILRLLPTEFLFIAIETAPIFVKLISSRSPYDYLLHEKEQVYQMANLENTTLLENSTMSTVKFDTEITQHRTTSQVDAEKELITHAISEKVQSLKNAPLDWKRILSGQRLLDS